MNHLKSACVPLILLPFLLFAACVPIYEMTAPTKPYSPAAPLEFLCVAADDELRVYSAAGPASPRLLGAYSPGCFVRDVVGQGRTRYIAKGDLGIEAIDLADPASPRKIMAYAAIPANVLSSAGECLFAIGRDKEFRVLDLSDPANPAFIGNVSLSGDACDAAVYGAYAYVAMGEDGLAVLDVSIPSDPRVVGAYDSGGAISSIAIQGSRAFLADSAQTLSILDLSDPANPRFLGGFDSSPGGAGLFGPTKSTLSSLAVNGDFVIATDLYMGLLAFEVTDPALPALVGEYSLKFGAQGVALSGIHAFVAAGGTGLWDFDMSDVSKPLVSANIDMLAYAQDVAVQDNYAYAADSQNGLVMINMSDPANPSLAGSYPCATYDVVVGGKYAYISEILSGFMVIDVSDPSRPKKKASYSEPGNVSIQSMTLKNGYLYLANWYKGLVICNVANPSFPTRTALYACPDLRCADVGGKYAYLLVTPNELRIVDISLPAFPRRAGSLRVSCSSRAELVKVSGQRAYVATDRGLVIIDVSDPAHPRELGEYLNGLEILNEIQSITPRGTLLYCTDNGGRFTIIDTANEASPALVSSMEVADDCESVSLYGDYAILPCGMSGLRVVNVAEPSAPCCVYREGYFHDLYY